MRLRLLEVALLTSGEAMRLLDVLSFRSSTSAEPSARVF